MVATAGFVGVLSLPGLFAVSAVLRGLVAAWAPAQLDLIEDGGGAPRFAGWLGAFVLVAMGLGWSLFEGTWLLFRWTAFKPMVISLAEPVIGVGGLVAAVIIARPLARGLTAIARSLDRRWRKRGHGSLITPGKLVLATVVTLGVTGWLGWHFAIQSHLGPLDLSALEVPAVALLALLFGHVAWEAWPGMRRFVGPLVGVLAVGAIVTALVALQTSPSLTLSIWGERPIAGMAIETLFDLDSIRTRVSLVEFRPTAVPGAEHPDIILVTIDTVRADHTPPYAGTAEMPVLKELGKRGTVFDWAFSPSNVTRRSIPSMIIGLAPDRIRGRVVGWALRIDPRHIVVAERLLAGGYETAGFMCCEGFYGPTIHTGLGRGLEHLEMEPNGLALAHRARAWLDARERQPTRKPLFLWMHILEPHNWAVANGDPGNPEARRGVYDRTLAQADAMVAEVLGAFSERAPDRAPIVIVSADHGEGLGDHGQVFHSTDLYNSQTHVPLVIAGPGIKQQRIAETVSLTDLTPSLLELAGFAVPSAHLDGVSFADLATGKRAPDNEGGTAYAAMIQDRSNPGGVTAIVHGRYKLIESPSGRELYDTRSDPSERGNLIHAKLGQIESLTRALEQHAAAAQTSPF